ncbi:MAG: hypothetical protein V7607_5799 [Solirubrobacteraceae bacterium]
MRAAVVRRLRIGMLVLLASATAAAAIVPAASAAVRRPFERASIWNMPVPEHARVAPNSAALVENLVGQVTTYGPWINTWAYSSPIYTVPSDQSRVRVRLDTTVPKLQAAFASVPLPAKAIPAAGTDGHLVVWQPATDRYWEFWKLRRASDGWHARWGGALSHASANQGYFPAPFGATGTGLPLFAGLIRVAELRALRIDHALALAIPRAKAHTFVWPAQRSDGASPLPDAIPEGTRLRIDPHLDLDTLGLPPAGLAIARAAQRYGILVRDQAGAVTFYGEDPARFGPPNPYVQLFDGKYASNVLANFPWRRLQVLAAPRDRGAR